ncbi:hypothetical protein CONPUDRAFT_78086 [Coniophora puteana RWD-64-598 SS2]|uniref:RNI-like protein n=1 Tax=Coniophora puteana (strain RWD-64-598) TaxID=741705 RepID=R7SE41_CONPW|nr:uncharacterized protein CONPUDRAFT_78086 [Coniophora puteana RWD-64-598 SS2]EIW74441.1 hypothetical protein CONPUDRAFT_78086 [Coniophora puteana RWD-64-598 SS2]
MRIRALRIPSLLISGVDERAAQKLFASSYTIEQVFPKLRSLIADSVNGRRSWSPGFYCSFFSSNLSTLNVEFSANTDAVEAWQLLSKQSPLLRSLKITPFRGLHRVIRGSPTVLFGPMSRAVERLRLLEHLECPDLDNNALHAVSQLPSLRYLSLWTKQTLLPTPTAMALRFPALQTLELYSEDYKNTMNFLRSLETPPTTVMLADLKLSSTKMEEFLSLLSQAHSQRLEDLEINGDLDIGYILDTETVITIKTLRPLLCQRSLKRLYLCCIELQLSLSQTDVQEIALSLPLLEEVEIRLGSEALVTLDGLWQFVQSLSHLTRLHVGVDISGNLDLSDEASTALATPSKLGSISLDLPRGDNLSALITMISRCFPALERLKLVSSTHFDTHTSPETLEPLLRLHRLKEVNLDLSLQYNLSDTDLATMTIAWPNLDVLSAHGASNGPFEPTSTSVTLDGILALRETRISRAVLQVYLTNHPLNLEQLLERWKGFPPNRTMDTLEIWNVSSEDISKHKWADILVLLTVVFVRLKFRVSWRMPRVQEIEGDPRQEEHSGNER